MALLLQEFLLPPCNALLFCHIASVQLHCFWLILLFLVTRCICWVLDCSLSRLQSWFLSWLFLDRLRLCFFWFSLSWLWSLNSFRLRNFFFGFFRFLRWLFRLIVFFGDFFLWRHWDTIVKFIIDHDGILKLK